MGKLHKLRRAIKRNPEKWKNAKGAHQPYRVGGEWSPANGYYRWNNNPYEKFVKHVLKQMAK